MQTLIPYPGRLLPILLCMLISNLVTAQSLVPYSPIKDDSVVNAQLISQITQRCKKDVDALKGSNRKYTADIYKERVDMVKNQATHKELITNEATAQYLRSVAALIIQANPELSALEPHFYFSRSAVPNACSMGEGTIIFNIGLFTKLQNEAQVAFVLSHELAHLYLNHGNNSIEKYVNTLYSKETQEELHKIKNAEYQQRAQLETLVKQFSFRNSRHSRDHESEADSMGVVFLRNTRFNTNAALTGLALLDTIDNDTFNTAAFLEHTFSCKEHPFQTRWLEKEEGLLGGHAALETDKKLEDSLKTHPDCQVRIKAVHHLVDASQDAARQDYLVSQQQFEYLKKAFSYEIVEFYFNINNLSSSLYYAAQLLSNDQTDPYIVAAIGKIFSRLYLAQKDHRMSTCTQLPAPYYSASYNTLLQFFQNLYLEDIATINYYFLQPYEQQLISYEDFVFALALSKRQNNKPQEQARWVDYYNKSFNPKKYSLN